MTRSTDETGAKSPKDRGALEDEVRALRDELALMRRHKMFVLFQSVPRVLLFRFASGMAVGLGTVIGATVLLSFLVWMVSQIELVPIIGQWATEIREVMSEIPSEAP